MQTGLRAAAASRFLLAARAIVCACCGLWAATAWGAPPAEAQIDYAQQIKPILASRCYHCHGPSKQESGLRLNQRESALAGGDSGERAIVPGKPEESRLIRLVRGDEPGTRMPPEEEGAPLSPEEIDLLTRWVAAGAPWPADADEAAAPPAHWAWRPPVQPTLPAVRQAEWCRTPIDYFVLAKLEEAGLQPSREADRWQLIRRVSLDLTGLPPTPAQVEEFVNDPSPLAYERLVDRLLADPAYGERWARMWLDLARYADSKGYGSDPLRTIWRYRDWVIDAFNQNMPYDRFTIEQLAGDLLPDATMEQVLATAFHRNTMANDEGGTDDEEFRVAAVKDRVETTMQVWMGLTAGCAKCHSHKYDPLTQREYYQLYAFFNQTEDADRPDESPRLATPTREQQRALAGLLAEAETLRRELAAPSLDLSAGQAAWEERLAAQESAWQVLLPRQATAGEAALEVLPDGTVAAGGANPATETYTIEADTNSAGITALRLEVLPDPRLPAGGPGRASGGNFVLSEVSVTVAEEGPRQARYVRVELPGQQRILSLAEVQVFSAEQNVAPSGRASQSSIDFNGRPELAIDGNASGVYEEGSVTHTRTEDDPWWELDLGSVTAVQRILLWNRTDNGLQQRLAGCRVKLLDEQRETVWEAQVADPPQSHVELNVGSAAASFSQASADFSQHKFDVSAAIDGDAGAASGWAVGPATGQAHVAILRFSQPVASRPGAALKISLVQNYGGQHTIGRFRLSAATVADPLPVPPRSIGEILAVPAGERSAEQQAALAAYYRSIAPELEGLRSRLAALEQQAAELQKQFPTTPVMRELPPPRQRTTHVLLKGNFLNPGDVVEPQVPAAFHPLRPELPRNRLGLALWLLDERNPLTARVAVNRFWAQLFGRGIVETEEDFGTQGTPPSHPELLDWLAVEFRKSWDVKALLRLMVTSAAYRQSSAVTPDLLRRDPYNRLISRGPRFRLEAEMVRDQALALAGLLSRKIGGPSVYPPQPEGLWRAAFNGDRTWPTSQGEDRYRRGLYTFWRRTVPYPSMAAFDAPSREICTLRRVSTNTPLQAFVTLNDPVYVEAAQALARRLMREGGATPHQRAAYGLRLCLVRPSEDEEVEALAALYAEAVQQFQTQPEAAATLATEPLGPLPADLPAVEAAAWTLVANVLLNHDGVLTRR